MFNFSFKFNTKVGHIQIFSNGYTFILNNIYVD